MSDNDKERSLDDRTGRGIGDQGNGGDSGERSLDDRTGRGLDEQEPADLGDKTAR